MSDKVPQILIIEDEPLISRIYSKKFDMEGFSWLIAENGEKGLSIAQREHPDLILCDVMMPEKDGLTTLKELKEDENTSDIPVIMLSNLSKQEYIDEAIEKGAAGYIIKSKVIPAEVVEKIREILEIG
jgi:DNA-binding response OmpR family regulator